MTTTDDVISPNLKTILRRLKLSRMLDTLPELLTLARQQKMPHQDRRCNHSHQQWLRTRKTGLHGSIA